MCSRYSFNLLKVDLGFLGLKEAVFKKRVQQVAPGQQVWLVRNNDEGVAELVQAKWGLAPSWLKDFSRVQINARVETAPELKMFSNAWFHNRCLILADSYYQWHMTPQNRRQLWRIGARDNSLILMAGLWERYCVDSTLSFDSCAVVTMPAMPQISLIAQRMPALLTTRCASRWLAGSSFDINSFTDPLTNFAFQSQNVLKG